MPTYDYECAACGGFEAVRRIAERDAACACPGCGAGARRLVVSAPHLEHLSGETRKAMDINERARHEPRSSSEGSYGRMRHPSGCGCCSSPGRRNSTTVTAPNGAKAFPTKRPWMISH
jgi:putative FmdB family regulatory protein